MLYDERTLRENIRNRDGKRVFFLGEKDRLTPSARDYVNREGIELRPGEQAKPEKYRMENGAVLEIKPEHMTHLHSDVLVYKTHPRIRFRGEMDSLQAELLLCQLDVPGKEAHLGEILALARKILGCEVMNEPLKEQPLCGLTQQELRSRSHRPQDYYGQPHFMPDAADGRQVLALNRCRCACRRAELAAAAAFIREDGTVDREDILRALNRMSSMLYLLMIEEKANKGNKVM